jgi:molybdenum cofactor cytidylyltransferase
MLKNYQTIVLAAGSSTRTSIPKGLMEVKGRPWLERQQLALKELGFGDYLIVLGVLEKIYQPFIDKKFTRILNPHPEGGPFSSLVCALSGEKNVFVLPLDVPCPKKQVWETLESNLKGKEAVMPVYQDRGGHPVLLSSDFTKRLMKVPLDSPDARLDRQLHLLTPDKIARIPVSDSSILMNLNTDEAFEEYRQCAS